MYSYIKQLIVLALSFNHTTISLVLYLSYILYYLCTMIYTIRYGYSCSGLDGPSMSRVLSNIEGLLVSTEGGGTSHWVSKPGRVFGYLLLKLC